MLMSGSADEKVGLGSMICLAGRNSLLTAVVDLMIVIISYI
jgi:hypothetical protein